MVEADLPTLERHGHDADASALRAERRFQVGQVLAVEPPNVVQTLPPVAARHHDQRTAASVHGVERNPGGDHLVGAAGRPVRAVRVPAGDGARRVVGPGRLVDELVVQHADGRAAGQFGRDGPQQRIDREGPQLTLL